MRLVVDLNRCQGYAQCAFLAPGTFSIRGDEVLVYDPAPDAGQRLEILRAVAACPVRAILAEGTDHIPEQRVPEQEEQLHDEH